MALPTIKMRAPNGHTFDIDRKAVPVKLANGWQALTPADLDSFVLVCLPHRPTDPHWIDRADLDSFLAKGWVAAGVA